MAGAFRCPLVTASSATCSYEPASYGNEGQSPERDLDGKPFLVAMEADGEMPVRASQLENLAELWVSSITSNNLD